ncbi:MAG: PilW family protein [Gammaproteobacteria bacterium]
MKRVLFNSLRGLSLVELMVALAIGSVLIVGALYMYQQGRSSFSLNERIARLQDDGRYVISVIEPDLELAGYYGFTNSPDTVRFVSGGDPNLVIATATRMRQLPVLVGDPVPTAVPNLPASAHACGRNFAVDVLTPVQGSNDVFALGPNASATDCGPRFGALAGADTLTLRRVSTQPSAAAELGRLQVYASRLRSRTSHLLFADGNAPGVVDADNQVHDLVVRTYYISQSSVGRTGYPALRVKTLTRIAGEPAFDDEEVMPGVEDLQVQFGIDTGDYDNDGVIDAGTDINSDGIPESDGRATRYVDPDFPDLARYQVVAVRLWVRVRAEQPEPGLTHPRPYRYARVEYTPAGAEQNFRRVVMSRTITLRNARTL